MKISDLDGGHATDGGRGRRALILSAGLFALVALLAAIDVAADIAEGSTPSHWVLELVVVVLGLVGLGAIIQQLRRMSAQALQLAEHATQLSEQLDMKDDEARELGARLAAKEEEAQRWRSEAKGLLEGLGKAIDEQFERWELTSAEKEVGLLLLKGLSHKEVAGVRGTSDATARQQARAVYKKGGLSGRNDLSAFFLEDLLLPRES